MILLYLLISLVVIMFIEYLGHRYPLHKPWTFLGRDHINHHKTFNRVFTGQEEEEASYDPVWVRGLFAGVWSSLVMLPFWFLCPLFGFVFVFVAIAHGTIWSIVHNEMHHPTDVWWNKTRYFKFIREFHKIHHFNMNKNFGFLFAPILDKVFGTYRVCY